MSRARPESSPFRVRPSTVRMSRARPESLAGYSGAPLLAKDGKFIGVVVGKKPNVAIPAEAIDYL